MEFKPYYFLKYPVLGAIKYWHFMNRVRPFTYERSNETRAKFTLLALFVVIVIIVSSI